MSGLASAFSPLPDLRCVNVGLPESLADGPTVYDRIRWADLRGSNRRFLYDGRRLVLSGHTQTLVGSHAEDYHAATGSDRGFDRCVRGWIGAGGSYPSGVIHFAPPVPADYPLAVKFLEACRKWGAPGKCVVRGFRTSSRDSGEHRLADALLFSMEEAAEDPEDIVQILDITDTRQWEEIEDDVWVPIKGSGNPRPCDRCGATHEIHVTVLLRNKERRVVGTTCMKQPNMAAKMRALSARYLTLRRNELKLAKYDALIAAWKDANRESALAVTPATVTARLLGPNRWGVPQAEYGYGGETVIELLPKNDDYAVYDTPIQLRDNAVRWWRAELAKRRMRSLFPKIPEIAWHRYSPEACAHDRKVLERKIKQQRQKLGAEGATQESALLRDDKMDEVRWIDAKPTDMVTLYHGTSSELLPRIKRRGLQPFSRRALIHYYLRKWGFENIDALPEYVRDAEASFRRREADPADSTDKVVFLASNKKQAEAYAASYARTGGEILYALRDALRRYASNGGEMPKGFDPERDALERGKPVVLTVEVPFREIRTWGDLAERQRRVLAAWADADSRERAKGLDAFVEQWGGFEARVFRTIPPSRIVKIEDGDPRAATVESTTDEAITDATLKPIVRRIRELFPEATGIELAGSAARGELDKGGKRSDVDVLIRLPKRPDLSDDRLDTLFREFPKIDGRTADFVTTWPGGNYVGQQRARWEKGLPTPTKLLWGKAYDETPDRERYLSRLKELGLAEAFEPTGGDVWLHGTDEPIDDFTPGRVGPQGVLFFSREADFEGRGRVQASYYARKGGRMLRVVPQTRRMRRFDPSRDPKAAAVLERLYAGKALPYEFELWRSRNRGEFGPWPDYVPYDEIPYIVRAAKPHGYNLFKVYEPSVQNVSWAVTDPSLVKVISSTPVESLRADKADEAYSSEHRYLIDYLRTRPLGVSPLLLDWPGLDGVLKRLRLKRSALKSAFKTGDYSEWEKLEAGLDDDERDQAGAFLADVDPANAPTWAHVSLEFQRQLPRQTWLVHFSVHADRIHRQGFLYGFSDMARLGLTTWFRRESWDKKFPGYNFAFEADSWYAREAAATGKYGRDAVLFQSSGVRVFHYGDNESQVIFDGRSVKKDELVLLRYSAERGKYEVSGGKRGTLFTGKFDDCVQWVKKNHAQYRRALRESTLLRADKADEASYGPSNVPKHFLLAFTAYETYPEFVSHLSRVKGGQIEGVKGISDSGKIVADWLGRVARNGLLVMPGEATVKLNRLSRIMYDNPHYLLSKNAAALNRIKNAARPEDSLQGALDYGMGETNPNRSAAIKRAAYGYKYEALGQRFAVWIRNGSRKFNSFREAVDLLMEFLNDRKEEYPTDLRFRDDYLAASRKEWADALAFGAVYAARVYHDEGEWLVKDGTLRIPPGSRLFILPPVADSDVYKRLEGKTDDELAALLKAAKDSLGGYVNDGDGPPLRTSDISGMAYYRRLKSEAATLGIPVKFGPPSAAFRSAALKTQARHMQSFTVMGESGPEGSGDYAMFSNDGGAKFWGNKGAGALVVCPSTGHVLACLRSKYVNEPNTYGTVGGKIDGGENVERALRREVAEELGYRGPLDLSPLSTFTAPGFRFHNYLAVVPSEFTPRLDWETERAAWVTLDEFLRLRSQWHFGLEWLWKQDGPAIEATLRKGADESVGWVPARFWFDSKKREFHPLAAGTSHTEFALSHLRLFGITEEYAKRVLSKYGDDSVVGAMLLAADTGRMLRGQYLRHSSILILSIDASADNRPLAVLLHEVIRLEGSIDELVIDYLTLDPVAIAGRETVTKQLSGAALDAFLRRYGIEREEPATAEGLASALLRADKADEAKAGVELYHTTSLGGLEGILRSRTLKAAKDDEYVSFSEFPLFGDITGRDAVIVFDAAKLRGDVRKVEYTEQWYDENRGEAAYVAGHGWLDRFVLPDYDEYPNYDPNDPDWQPEPEDDEAFYREAELSAFLDKSHEREWVADSPLRFPPDAIKRVIVPKHRVKDVQRAFPNAAYPIVPIREADLRSVNADGLAETRWPDLYGGGFVDFRKKYLKLASKRYYVQFTNDPSTDVLARSINPSPSHGDPSGVYAYPLAYVVKYPADVWYGQQAQYLRVLEPTPSARILDLQSLSEQNALSLLTRGLKVKVSEAEAMMKAAAKYVRTHYRGAVTVPRAFFVCVQYDLTRPQDRESGSRIIDYPRRSNQEQADILMRMGFDAVEDTAKRATRAAVNDREPEQIVFLRPTAFRVVETFRLGKGSRSGGVGTVTEPRTYVRRLAAMLAQAMDDQLKGPSETANLNGWEYFWTRGGSRIEISFAVPPSYYDRPIGSKPHKSSKLESPHSAILKLHTPRGLYSVRFEAHTPWDDIARSFRGWWLAHEGETDAMWTPETRQSYLSDQERKRRERVLKELENEHRFELERSIPELLADLAWLARHYRLPWTPPVGGKKRLALWLALRTAARKSVIGNYGFDWDGGWKSMKEILLDRWPPEGPPAVQPFDGVPPSKDDPYFEQARRIIAAAVPASDPAELNRFAMVPVQLVGWMKVRAAEKADAGKSVAV